MRLTEGIVDTIVNYIVKGKVSTLEKAFKKSPTLVGYIKDYYAAHEKFMKTMDDWCKKHPDSCNKRNIS